MPDPCSISLFVLFYFNIIMPCLFSFLTFLCYVYIYHMFHWLYAYTWTFYYIYLTLLILLCHFGVRAYPCILAAGPHQLYGRATIQKLFPLLTVEHHQQNGHARTIRAITSKMAVMILFHWATREWPPMIPNDLDYLKTCSVPYHYPLMKSRDRDVTCRDGKAPE